MNQKKLNIILFNISMYYCRSCDVLLKVVRGNVNKILIIYAVYLYVYNVIMYIFCICNKININDIFLFVFF